MPYPKTLLKNVYWSCGHKIYESRASFKAALVEYQDDINPGIKIDLDELVLEAQKVELCFECWQGDEQVEPTIMLECEQGFTTLELMFQLVNGLAGWLNENNGKLWDHHFFEGLSLSKKEGIPLYFVRFGS